MDQHTNKTQKILNTIIIVLLLAVIALGGYYYVSTNNTKATSTASDGTTLQSLMPAEQKVFNFTTIDGEIIEVHASPNKFEIKGMENKLVFFKIFGWNCKYCKKEIPELIKLKRDLSDEFEVIAIEAEHATVEESLIQKAQYGINYPIVSGDDYFDFYGYLKVNYAWNDIIPLTIVISKEGNVQALEVGSKSYSLSELMKASLIQSKSAEND